MPSCFFSNQLNNTLTASNNNSSELSREWSIPNRNPGVGTQVPLDTGSRSVPASSRHCSPFGGGVQGMHIVIGEASSGGTEVVPGSPPGDVGCSFTDCFLMLTIDTRETQELEMFATDFGLVQRQ